jgi:hypothetical protein
MLILRFLIVLDIVKTRPKSTSLIVSNIAIRSIASKGGFNLSQS